MKTKTILLGQSEQNATQELLEDCFTKWKYSSIWKKSILPNNVSSSLLGIEFQTTDIPSLQQNLPQLLMMGCNHFQWVIKQSEELAFIKQSPFLATLLQQDSPLFTRQGIILTLHILSSVASEAPIIIEQSAHKMEIEQWDRIWLPLDSFKASQSLSDNIGLSISEDIFSSEEPSLSNEIMASFSDNKPIQIPLHLKSFIRLLSDNKGQDMLSFFEKHKGEISFRALSLEGAGEGYTMLQSSTDKMKNTQQHIQTLLALLKADERKLNNKITKWSNEEHQDTDLVPFDYIKSLEEACDTVESTTNWEQYLSELWFPSFQHHVRSWTSFIPSSYQQQWRWMIDQMMEHVHELLGVQSQTIRMKQAHQLFPFLQALDQNFPKLPTMMTFEAKYLLLLASTPWPETIFFPWKALDSAIEYLGLMRFPHLDNVDSIFKNMV